MGAIEKWTAGKFEFRYFVFSANGTKIKDRKFSSIKRKKVKDLKWHDFNDFIAYWNTSNLGNFMIEGWVERDGGKDPVNIVVTIPSSCTGCPAISASVSVKEDDDELGQSIVQFTDPVQPTDPTATIYQISNANFKRKH